jgi:hypothetical protein
VARTGYRVGAYRGLMRKYEEKSVFGILRHRYEDNVKVVKNLSLGNPAISAKCLINTFVYYIVCNFKV